MTDVYVALKRLRRSGPAKTKGRGDPLPFDALWQKVDGMFPGRVREV